MEILTDGESGPKNTSRCYEMKTKTIIGNIFNCVEMTITKIVIHLLFIYERLFLPYNFDLMLSKELSSINMIRHL